MLDTILIAGILLIDLGILLVELDYRRDFRIFLKERRRWYEARKKIAASHPTDKQPVHTRDLPSSVSLDEGGHSESRVEKEGKEVKA